MRNETRLRPATPWGEVLKPNGGETLIAGLPSQIKWIANDDGGITSVDLYYSTNGGSSWTTIATGEPHDGYYTWTPPAIDANQCRIRIVVHDANGHTSEDTSNANFTIKTGVGIKGSWVTGLSHPNEPGNNRTLIFIAHAERTGK